MTSRTLLLARHAKAVSSADTDDARALSTVGHADAAAVGRWLTAGEFSFDLVICSTSVRTRQTWRDIEAAGVTAAEVTFDERVYGAGRDDLLAVLAEVPDAVASLLVIGHAPTIPELAELLADPDASVGAALETLRSSFPAGCLAVLDVPGSWTALQLGGASLTELVTPQA